MLNKVSPRSQLKGFCRHLQNGLVALPDHFSALINLCVLDAHANPFPCLPEVTITAWHPPVHTSICTSYAQAAQRHPGDGHAGIQVSKAGMYPVCWWPGLHSTLVFKCCLLMPGRGTRQMKSAPSGSPAQLLVISAAAGVDQPAQARAPEPVCLRLLRGGFPGISRTAAPDSTLAASDRPEVSGASLLVAWHSALNITELLLGCTLLQPPPNLTHGRCRKSGAVPYQTSSAAHLAAAAEQLKTTRPRCAIVF